MTYYIKIDCPPGMTRPNNILQNIITKLKLDIPVPTDYINIFGEWTFNFSDKKEMDILKQNEDNIITEIKSYYPNYIRYAEWYFN